jgi:hypothetical protein
MTTGFSAKPHSTRKHDLCHNPTNLVLPEIAQPIDFYKILLLFFEAWRHSLTSMTYFSAVEPDAALCSGTFAVLFPLLNTSFLLGNASGPSASDLVIAPMPIS